MRFPWQEAVDFDRAILDLSAGLGRRIDRTEAIRGLARLFVADERLAERAIQAAADATREAGAEQERESGRRGRDTGLGGL